MSLETPEINTADLRPWAGLVPAEDRTADVTIAGVPFEGEAFYRRGTALAPERIRRLSAVMPPVTETGRLIDVAVRDIGDATLFEGGVEPNIEPVAQWLLEHVEGVQVVLGGDHTVAIPSVLASHRRHGPDLAVITFDAHPDVCDTSHGSRWNIGCAVRRAIEVAGIPPGRLTQVGVRDFDLEEVLYLEAEGVNFTTMRDAAALPPPAMRERLLRAVPRGAPVHLSLDIDVLDPAFAPGTEIPSAGGATTRQVLEWLAALGDCHLVALDLVEVSPPLDHSDITSFAALKLIFEFLGLLAETHRAAP